MGSLILLFENLFSFGWQNLVEKVTAKKYLVTDAWHQTGTPNASPRATSATRETLCAFLNIERGTIG
jgi:hypothetical protein